jgi:hypothetical protein
MSSLLPSTARSLLARTARAQREGRVPSLLAGVVREGGLAWSTARAARGFAVHPWADVLLPEPEEDAGAMAAAGQLWSTLTDLSRLAAFLLGSTGDVLHPDTLEEMTIASGVDPSAPGWSAYGLGLQVVRHGDATLVGHGGSMPGFLASVFVDREQDLGTVVLCNATSGLDGSLVGDLQALVREAEPALGATWTPGPAEPEAFALVGAWYWGTYAYGLRLRADGLLDLVGLLGAGRASRFRSRGDGSWVGLDGYHAGEVLQPVRSPAGDVVALDLGTFVFSRTPYDPAAPHPGGVHPEGWGPHQAAGA